MTTPTRAPLALSVNGEAFQAPPDATVRALLKLLQLDGRRIAVAVNRDVVPRSEHDSWTLSDGDRVEILEAVGGG